MTALDQVHLVLENGQKVLGSITRLAKGLIKFEQLKVDATKYSGKSAYIFTCCRSDALNKT